MSPLPVWAIALIVLGGILGIVIFVFAACGVASSRRKRRYEARAEAVYQQEKRRAEDTLATLKALRQAKSQQQPQSPVGVNQAYYAAPPTMIPVSGVPMAQSGFVGTPPGFASTYPQGEVYSQGGYGYPQGGVPVQVAVQPIVPQTQACYVGRAPGFTPSPPQNGGRDVMRLAASPAEIPKSPPPVAPPGFVTVPMVIDHYA